MLLKKIKFTKGEFKRQKDQLQQFERYLPTLQLKKQQLQFEVLQQQNILLQSRSLEKKKIEHLLKWIALFNDPQLKGLDPKSWLRPKQVITQSKNIAGLDVPVFVRAEFEAVEYDLFFYPPWLDYALEALRDLVALQQEISILEQGLKLLKEELRITNQRVNLFEKVKIPQAQEAIRRIKIFIGDQMANAVGRSKLAKKKLKEVSLEVAFR